ncbi:MAG: YncE family protein, partial [Chloroflexi bacterium]|nr:YncE family protein [Chloroflexota bacterium]
PGSTATLLPTASLTATAVQPTPGCRDLIVDGGFEQGDDAWYIPQTAYPAGYTTAHARSGLRSMRLGIDSGNNVFSYSTVRQKVHVPAEALDPVLVFWYYPVSGDTQHDLQYALIQDGNGTSEWPLYVRSNAQAWTRVEYRLPATFKGKEITLYFGVLNDGGGGTTAMYVDDVSLLVCGVQPTPTPTSTSSDVRVVLPLILRGSQEQDGSGQIQLLESAPPGPTWSVSSLWRPAQVDVAPDFLQGVALYLTDEILYAAAGKEILVFDAGASRILATIPVDAAPRGLAIDVVTNRLFAGLPDKDALAVIDTAENIVRTIVPGIPGASGVAVGTDHIYVTATRSDELVVIDGRNYAIIGRITVGDAPFAVAYDAGRQRVYVGNAGEDTISIVDGRNHVLLNTVKLGGLGHPHSLAVDPIRNRLYVTYALSPKYRAIAAIDASSGEVLSRLVGNEDRPLFAAYGLAVEPLRGWVYVTTVDELFVLAGESLQVISTVSGVGPVYAFGVAIHPTQDRLYLADARHRGLTVLGK